MGDHPKNIDSCGTTLAEKVEELGHGGLDLKLRSVSGVLIVFLTGFAQMLDNISLSGVTLALPSIGDDLAIEGTQLSYMISAYAISFGALLLLAGGISDRYGQKNIFCVGILLVGICSLIISFLDSIIPMLVLRGIQGVGAAFSVPSALGFLSLAFREQDRKASLAIFGAFGGIGFTLGLVLGGVVSSTIGWPWIFRLVAIMAFFNSILSFVYLPDLKKELDLEDPFKAGRRLDILGAFLATTGLVLLIYSFTSSSDFGWDSALILAPLLASFLCLGLFVFVESRVSNPLMPLRIWNERNFASLWLCGLILYIWWQTVTYYLTLICQEVFDLSPIQTSLRLLPIGIVGFFSNIGAGYLFQKFESKVKWILVLALSGCSLVTLPLPLTSLYPLSHSHQILTHVLVFSFLAPLPITTAYISINTSIILSLPRSEQSLAGGMANTAFQLGCALGPSIASAIQNSSIPSQAVRISKNLTEEGSKMVEYRPPLWFLMGSVGFAAVLALVTVRNLEIVEKDVELQEAVVERRILQNFRRCSASHSRSKNPDSL